MRKKVKMTVILTVDCEEWGADYGMDPLNVPADVVEWVSYTLHGMENDAIKDVQVSR